MRATSRPIFATSSSSRLRTMSALNSSPSMMSRTAAFCGPVGLSAGVELLLRGDQPGTDHLRGGDGIPLGLLLQTFHKTVGLLCRDLGKVERIQQIVALPRR